MLGSELDRLIPASLAGLRGATFQRLTEEFVVE
jgi:hypothetical protein